MHWAGHVTRICMPKAVFFSELQEGKHHRGAPRKCCKEQLKRQLAQAGINHQSWQQEASDWDSWCFSMRKSSSKFGAKRHEASTEKTEEAEKWAASQSSLAKTFPCPKRSSLSRVCASRTRLYSHQRPCKNWPSTFPKSLSARNQPLSSPVKWTCNAPSLGIPFKTTFWLWCTPY